MKTFRWSVRFINLINNEPTIRTLLPLSPTGMEDPEDETFKLTTEATEIGGFLFLFWGGPYCRAVQTCDWPDFWTWNLNVVSTLGWKDTVFTSLKSPALFFDSGVVPSHWPLWREIRTWDVMNQNDLLPCSSSDVNKPWWIDPWPVLFFIGLYWMFFLNLIIGVMMLEECRKLHQIFIILQDGKLKVEKEKVKAAKAKEIEADVIFDQPPQVLLNSMFLDQVLTSTLFRKVVGSLQSKLGW